MFGIESLALYTGIIGAAAIGGEIVKIAIKRNKGTTDKLATGSFGKVKDMKSLLGNDGIQISKNIRLSQKASYEGITVIGSTGSGKSTAVIISNLLNDELPRGSIVVSDPKGEIYKLTSNHLRNKGLEPMVFFPLSTENSMQYNPLEMCRSAEEVTQLAETLLLNGELSIRLQSGKSSNNGEWVQMSTPLLSASLLYCKAKGYPLNNISNALKILINNPMKDIELIFKASKNDDVMEQFNVFKTVSGSERTAASILITLSSSLKLFLDKNVIKTTMKSNFSGEMLRKKGIALFISIPERNSDAYSPLTATIYRQLINHAMDYTGNPITWFWDEFANIGLIPSFTKIVSTTRSREMSFLICLQDLSQLYNIYGRDNAKTILNNLKTKAVLPGLSDPETLSYISTLCGETEIKIKNTSTSKSNGKTTNSTSYSSQRKKLLNEDEIRRLDNEDIVIIPHNKKVIKDVQNIYYKQSKYLLNVVERELPIA